MANPNPNNGPEFNGVGAAGVSATCNYGFMNVDMFGASHYVFYYVVTVHDGPQDIHLLPERISTTHSWLSWSYNVGGRRYQVVRFT
jgi:hypothetical protein